MAFSRFASSIGTSVGERVAKGVLRGIIISHSKRWTLQTLQQMVGTGQGVHELVPPDILPSLRFQGQKYPSLREIPCQEFLEWVREGNPNLFDQIVSTQPVLNWLLEGWGEGIKELFRTENP